MEIPKIITTNYKQYIFVKEYPNFYLYENMSTHIKEAFREYDLLQIIQKEYDGEKHIDSRRYLNDCKKELC